MMGRLANQIFQKLSLRNVTAPNILPVRHRYHDFTATNPSLLPRAAVTTMF